MAPPNKSVFFPSLAACLDEPPKLLSWKDVAIELQKSAIQPLEETVSRFIQDPACLQILTNCFTPQKPNVDSKAKVETLTSAINVVPTPSGRYDIKELKVDSSWLSKSVDIDEVQALRLAILEWQLRPAQESMLNLGEVDFKDFVSVKARRQRLLQTFFQEQSWLLRCVQMIVGQGLYGPSQRQSIRPQSHGVVVAADALLKSWNISASHTSRDSESTWLHPIKTHMEAQIDHFRSGSKILSREDMQEYAAEGLGALQAETCILTVVHGLQIILLLQWSQPGPCQPQLILDWFQWMESSVFFVHLCNHPLISGTQYQMQIEELLVLCSLAFIDLAASLRILPDLASSSITSDGHAAEVYLQSIDCIAELNRTIGTFIESGSQVVAPAGIAWCSLLNLVHIYASQSIEHRENRQTQKAIDQYGAFQSDSESQDGSVTRRRRSPQRRFSTGSDASGQATLFEDIDDIARSHPLGEDTIKHFGSRASVDLGGFSVVENVARGSLGRLDHELSSELTTCIREILVQFIVASIDLGSLNYSQGALNILFTVLGGRDGHWKFSVYSKKGANSLQRSFQPLGNDPLLRDIMTCARGRFPLEGVPFIELCRTLLPYQAPNVNHDDLLLDLVSSLETFTALVIEPEIPYDLVGEGDSLQLHLLQSFEALAMMFPSIMLQSGAPQGGSFDPLALPTGTRGQALRDEKPIIALWDFNYSALRLAGLTLQLQLQLRTSPVKESRAEFHRLYLLNTEVIALLGAWIVKIASEGNPHDSVERAQALLANISDDLDRNQDVVAVILELLEGELYKTKPEPAAVEFIFRCLQFLIALAKVLPGRVWSYLSRSGLLGLHGYENKLSAVVAAAEMPMGQYDILLSAVQLLDLLVDNSVKEVTSRQPQSTALKRFRATDADTNGIKIQDITAKKILQAFIRVIVDVLETSASWKFNTAEYRLSLRLGIYAILHKIVSYTFDYDDDLSTERKLAADLGPAAAYIQENFLSEASNETLLQPLFQDLVEAAIQPVNSLPLRIPMLRQTLASTSLELITKLIRLNTFLSRPTSHLTKKVYEEIPTLAALFGFSCDNRLPVVRCIEAALRDAGPQPAPILGALTEHSGKGFIRCLSTLGLPSTDHALSAATWMLFSAAVAQKQQWFAVYLLQGKTPKESLKDKSSKGTKPVIHLALQKLATLESLHPEEAVKLLEFVALSANLWTSVTEELRGDKECRDACLRFLEALPAPSEKDKTLTDSSLPMKLQIAGYIVNVLAIIVHQSKQNNEKLISSHMLTSIKYLVEHAASPPQYNASLHHGLQKNFNGYYSGCNLQHFKRTKFSQPMLGENFYYDKVLAGTMFNHDKAWYGKDGKGFVAEFTRANINLSLVESQVELFHCWKTLAMELSESLVDDTGFQKTMTVMIKNCLQANAVTDMTDSVFERLCISRSDLAFALLQRLTQIAPCSANVQSVLYVAWASIHQHMPELGPSLVGSNATYIRTLLRTLYLALCAHGGNAGNDTSNQTAATGVALDVIQTVAAEGFRSLVAQLHQDSSRIQPQDFALIIAILRASLLIPGVTGHSERLLAHFADERTIQHAGTLMSWADQLSIDGDPVYGELSIMFLLELSTVQVLAEAIVVGGIYSQISSTTLFTYFRRDGGSGPFDSPPRMYNIWSRGYLPLTLNVLAAIGAPVAIEIATTLGQFAPQMTRASIQFDPKQSGTVNGRVTLSMINEAHSLALLSLVLNKFREAGSSVGIVPADLTGLAWDSSSVKEDLESLLGRRHALRESIAILDEREEVWLHDKPLGAKDGAQSRLEEKIVDEISAALALLAYSDQ